MILKVFESKYMLLGLFDRKIATDMKIVVWKPKLSILKRFHVKKLQNRRLEAEAVDFEDF